MPHTTAHPQPAGQPSGGCTPISCRTPGLASVQVWPSGRSRLPRQSVLQRLTRPGTLTAGSHRFAPSSPQMCHKRRCGARGRAMMHCRQQSAHGCIPHSTHQSSPVQEASKAAELERRLAAEHAETGEVQRRLQQAEARVADLQQQLQAATQSQVSASVHYSSLNCCDHAISSVQVFHSTIVAGALCNARLKQSFIQCRRHPKTAQQRKHRPRSAGSGLNMRSRWLS